MNNLSPTNDQRIFESAWFVDAKRPLIENKIYYAKSDNLLYYITAHRGPSTDDLAASPETVKGVTLNDTVGMEDTSIAAFNKLAKFLDKPV